MIYRLLTYNKKINSNMNDLVLNQLIIFVIAIVFGVVMGLIYDFIRLFRRIIPHNKIAIGAQDLIYWLVASIFVFYYVFKTNSGSIRGFIFIAISIGVLIYMGLFSEIFLNTVSKLIIKFINVVKKIFLILIKPIFFLLKPITHIFKLIIKLLKKTKKCLIIRIRNFIREIKIIVNKI